MNNVFFDTWCVYHQAGIDLRVRDTQEHPFARMVAS
jgi:hypothetical protein